MGQGRFLSEKRKRKSISPGIYIRAHTMSCPYGVRSHSVKGGRGVEKTYNNKTCKIINI